MEFDQRRGQRLAKNGDDEWLKIREANEQKKNYHEIAKKKANQAKIERKFKLVKTRKTSINKKKTIKEVKGDRRMVMIAAMMMMMIVMKIKWVKAKITVIEIRDTV